MLRASLLSLVLGIGAVAAVRSRVMWPYQATVTEPHGRSVAFRAITLGGELVFVVGGRPERRLLRTLARGDTLRATTPVTYALDPTRGPVVFFTSGRDSIRVVVGRNPFGRIDPVSAQGRRLTVRLVSGSVVIDAR